MNNLPDDIGSRLRDSLNRGSAPQLSTELVTGAADHAAPKLTNPARRLQFAGGAGVLVAAVAVTALALGTGVHQAPLFTAASSSHANSASGTAAESGPMVDMRIWAEYHYFAGAGLSTAAGSGNVYQLVRNGAGDARASEIAAVFGLSGKAGKAPYSDPGYPTWTIGALDGSTPSVSVTWAGAGDWWFSDPAASPAFACDSTGPSAGSAPSSGSARADGIVPPAVPVPTDAPSTGVIATPDPMCMGSIQTPGPNSAPTGAAAKSLAQQIFAQTGLDVATGDIRIYSDSSQTTATANLVVNGVQTALDWGVTWSNTGKIASAYGHSISVVDRGSYSTISAKDAVARLSDGRWSGAAGPDYQGGVMAYAADGIRSSSPSSSNGTTVAPVPSEPTPGAAPDPAVTPLPVGPPTAEPSAGPTAGPTAQPTDLPTPVTPPTATPTLEPSPLPVGPQVIDVTIDKAEPTLLMMWDSAGNAWLVPGYAMKVSDGWWNGVVSLVPGVIELPQPATIDPAVPEVGVPTGK